MFSEYASLRNMFVFWKFSLYSNFRDHLITCSSIHNILPLPMWEGYSSQLVVWLLIEGSHYFTHKMDVGGYFLRTGTN